MYQFVSNATNPPSIIYIGKDKYENDQLIKHGYGENDVWFHVDRLSSAHLYLKLIPGFAWDNLPQELLIDCSQLVKANSIEGNKKNNVDILYTPWNNLKKTQGMEVGEVAFHKPNQVKRFHVEKKDNAILNRLQKTKTEYTIDYEQEKIAREKGLRALQKDQEKAKKAENIGIQNAKRAQEQITSYGDIFQQQRLPISRALDFSETDIHQYEDELFM
ncbi:hypothetical protein MDAP_000141 [Mitosporidium daphniae]